MTAKQIKKQREELRELLYQHRRPRWAVAEEVAVIHKGLLESRNFGAAAALWFLPWASAAAHFADLTAEEIASLALDGLMVRRKKGGRS